MGDYSSGDEASLPADTTNLDHVYDATDLSNVGTDDTNYVDQTGSSGYEIHMYKDTITAANVNITWKGKSSLAPSTSKVQLQAYKVATPAGWVDVSGAGASNNTANADTDFTLSGTIATADYLDTGVTTFRIYQAAAGIQLGADLYASLDGDMEYADASYWPAITSPSTREKVTADGSQELHLIANTNDGAQGIGNASQYISLTAGTWYRIGCKLKRGASGNPTARLYDDTATIITCAANEYTISSLTAFRASGISYRNAGFSRMQLVAAADSSEMYFDDVYVKPITKSSLFTQQVDEGSANVTVSVAVTHPLLYACPAGVAICMSANDPSKYIIGVVNRINGYQDFVQVYLVDGTTVTLSYSGAISGATYGAGKVIQLVNNSNSLTVNYDGVQQATGIDTTGYTGTICAVFNSDDANTMASFTHTTP